MTADLDDFAAFVERAERRIEWLRLHNRHNSTTLALCDDAEALIALVRPAAEITALVAYGPLGQDPSLAQSLYRETERFAADEFTVGAYNDGIDAAFYAIRRALDGAS
jgi:hypothetical protein